MVISTIPFGDQCDAKCGKNFNSTLKEPGKRGPGGAGAWGVGRRDQWWAATGVCVGE